jgi:hypothetical protein
MSMKPEPFQRTDISTQPLGPTNNYTGSNTATCKCKVVDQVQTLTTEAQLSGAAIMEELQLADTKGEQKR